MDAGWWYAREIEAEEVVGEDRNVKYRIKTRRGDSSTPRSSMGIRPARDRREGPDFDEVKEYEKGPKNPDPPLG
jgi:hypothetical protein